MRGKLSLNSSNIALNGITPADAGKTESRTEDKAHEQDHPRGCGENLLVSS